MSKDRAEHGKWVLYVAADLYMKLKHFASLDT